MAENTTNDSSIIFHRTQTNAKDAFIIQEDFIETYLQDSPVNIVDYITGSYKESKEMLELITNKNSKLIAIIQSPVSRRERHLRYDMHAILDFYKDKKTVDIYHMDADGKLYKEVENPAEIFSKL